MWQHFVVLKGPLCAHKQLRSPQQCGTTDELLEIENREKLQNILSWKGPTRIIESNSLVNGLYMDWTHDLQPTHRWVPEAETCIKYFIQYQTPNDWQGRKLNPDFPSPSSGFSAQEDLCFAKLGVSNLFLVLLGSDEAGNIPAKEGSGDEYEKWNKYTCN